jgi:hypothetical protein
MGEEGEDTLGKIFTERFGSGSDWRLRSPTAVIFWREPEKRKKNRGRRKRRLNRYRWQGASLVGALPCPKGASEGGTLRAYVVQRPLPAVAGWMAPCNRVQIWKMFYRVLFV